MGRLELWDVLDEDGVPTGRTVRRGDTLKPGEFHLVVHVWIRNEHNDYLIQRRAEHLDWKPGIWATTGGSVVAGEDSLTGAIRETQEELGLDLQPTRLERIHRFSVADGIIDVWFAQVKTDLLGTPSPGPEVAQVMWASKAQIHQLANEGRFHRYSYLDEIPA